LHNEEEILEARQRSREWREMMEEHCPQGGALLGDEPIEEAVQVTSSLMPCPNHLSEAARSEWNRISADQKDALSPADAPALAAYCVAYERWTDAELKIQEHGTIIKNKAGNAVPNPYVTVAQQSLDVMHKFLTLLQHNQADSRAVF